MKDFSEIPDASWDPAKTVVRTDPEQFGGVSGMDLTQVEAEVTQDWLAIRAR
jgi:hypothetical protein